MSNEKKKNGVKTLSQKISDSSQKFLASFLDDDIKSKKAKEKLTHKINLAVSQSEFVVLQVAEPNNPDVPFTTLAGKLRKNNNNDELVVITLQKTKEIRMIRIDDIKKISFIQPKEADTIIAE